MAFNPTDKQNKLFKEEDLEEMIKHIIVGRGFNMEKVTKRIFLEMAQTFIEEVLDLSPSEKQNLTKEVIARQILVKFPEIARDDPNVELIQRRNMEIEKE